MSDLGGLSARIGLNTAPLRAGRVDAERQLVAVEGSLLRVEKASGRMAGAFGRSGKLIGAFVGFELIKKAAEGIKGSIEYAIDLEATMRRVEGVFGKSSEAIVKFSDEADKTLGQTKEQALQTSVRFGTLATQFGATQEQAAGMSEALVKLGNDLAHSKGTSVEQATGALATGLVGRGRALRLYGVDLSSATVKQEALKEGLIATVEQGLTPAQTFQASYNLILAQTTKQQGFFSKNLDTTKEKLEIAHATLRDASEELGVSFAPAAKQAADILSKDVAPALKTVGEGFAFLSEHKTAARMIEIAGGASLLAVAVAKIGKAYKETRAFYAETAAAHSANAAAIKAEGTAAAATSVQLGELAAAEALAGGGAAGAAVATTGYAGALTAAEVAALRGKKMFVPLGGKAGMGALGAIGIGLTASYYGGKLTNAVGADGEKRGGLLGDAEKLYGKIEHETNPLTPFTRAWGGLNHYFGSGDKKKDEPKPKPAGPLRIGAVGVAAGALGAARHQYNIDTKLAGDPAARSADAGLVGGTLGGAFDELPTTATGDPAKAAAAVKNASDRVASATDRLSLAQQKLNELRRSGKASALQLASATDSVSNAQRNLERAQGGLKGSKAAQAAASGTTALDFAKVSTRLGGQLDHTRGLTNSARRLIRDGVSRPVLIELEKLEQTAPGTLAKLAGTMTKAQAASLNKQYASLQAAWAAFLATPREAAIAEDKLKVAREAAAYAAAVRRAYATALQNDGLPVPGSGSVGQGKSARGAGHNVPGISPVTNNFNMPNAVIVASDPVALAAELARRKRINNLAGRP